MRLQKIVALALVISIVLVSSLQITVAQDDMMEKVTCDSTLATLLLIAEFDYDYLSHKMAMDMMEDPALSIDLGVLQPVADEISAMMMEMMEEDDMMEEGDDMMSEDDMMAHDEMLEGMMGMSAAEAVDAYMSSMNMEMMDMMELPAGDIAGEDPICAEVRADVQQFLVAHILTHMSMEMMDDGM